MVSLLGLEIGSQAKSVPPILGCADMSPPPAGNRVPHLMLRPNFFNLACSMFRALANADPTVIVFFIETYQTR